MEELVCPHCKTTKFRNPSMKLMVNICGHALCESCVDLLFFRGTGACPDCRVPLRRSLFRVLLFEDPVVEREVDIRRRILKDFSKREPDFSTLRDYNDYLEEVETIVFNLLNNIEIIETNKKIEQYKRNNKEQIAKSKLQMHGGILELETILEKEKLRSEMMRVETLSIEKEEKLRRLKTQEALIDNLMYSDTDAKSIVTSHKSMKNRMVIENEAKNNGTSMPTPSRPSQPVSFTSGTGFGTIGSTFLPVQKMEEEDVPLFTYEEVHLDLGGLNPPSIEELKEAPTTYLSHVKAATAAEVAGGFHSSISCRRALQDAFADITFQPKLCKQPTAATEPEPMDII